jgi:hypothetical protein
MATFAEALVSRSGFTWLVTVLKWMKRQFLFKKEICNKMKKKIVPVQKSLTRQSIEHMLQMKSRILKSVHKSFHCK